MIRDLFKTRSHLGSGTARGALLAGLLVAPMFGGAAHAQEAQAQQPVAQEPSEGLEEIVVTARRVSESLQTTGVSVAAFTSDRLESLNIDTAADIARFTPNLELKTRGGAASQGLAIKIRGIGVSDVDYAANDPSVAVYIDGIFQARAFGPQFELFDLERIEVLRGPQGTLYGKNSLGGAINIVTRKPDGVDSASMDLTVGSYGRLNFSARVGTTLIDEKLFLSLAGTTRTRNGLYDNLFAEGLDPADENQQAVRGALRWLPTSNVTVDLVADYSRQRQHAQGFFIAALTDNPGHLARAALVQAGYNPSSFIVGMNPSPRRLRQTQLDYDSGTGGFLPPNRGGRGRSIDNADFGGASLTIAAELSDDTTLRSFTSYRKYDRFLSHDLDGSPAQILSQTKGDEGEQLTQEIQLNTKLFDGKLDLVIGAFGLKEDLAEDQANGFVLGLAGINPALRSLSPRAIREYQNKSLAGFIHGIFNVTDRFRIIGGARYSWENKKAFFRVGQLQNEGVFDNFVDRKERSFKAFTPKLGVEYEVNDKLFTYASVAKGYSSGGFSPRVSALRIIEDFDQETLWSYEAGFKSTLLNRKLRFNAAIFRMDYDNIVIQSFGPAPPGSALPFGAFTGNGGRARVQGVEADIEFRPFRNLLLSGGLGLLDQKFKDFGVGPAGDPIDPSTAHFFDSPATTANVVVSYTLPIDRKHGAFTIGGDWSYRGRNWFDNSNTVVSSQDPYSLFAARISYTTPSERLTLSVFGENLTNEVYALRTLNLLGSAFGHAGVLFGQPRTFGARIGYKF